MVRREVFRCCVCRGLAELAGLKIAGLKKGEEAEKACGFAIAYDADVPRDGEDAWGDGEHSLGVWGSEVLSREQEKRAVGYVERWLKQGGDAQ